MCHNKQLFVNMESLQHPVKVSIGDGRELEAIVRGSVHLNVALDGSSSTCCLHDVLYVPHLEYNLISISKAGKAGKVSRFNDKRCDIMNKDGTIIASGVCEGSLYSLSVEEERANIAADIWHQRYGYLNHQSLRALQQKEMVIGLNLDKSSKPSFCNACAKGKSSSRKFPSSNNKRHDTLFDLVHSDVCEKITPKSLCGSEYFVTFIDDHSRYVWVYFMKTKNEVFDKFLEWKVMVENQYGKKIKTLRTDNGGEYLSGKFKAFLKKEGVRHELTVPKTPEQNGVAERVNRTLTVVLRKDSSCAEWMLPQHS